MSKTTDKLDGFTTTAINTYDINTNDNGVYGAVSFPSTHYYQIPPLTPSTATTATNTSFQYQLRYSPDNPITFLDINIYGNTYSIMGEIQYLLKQGVDPSLNFNELIEHLYQNCSVTSIIKYLLEDKRIQNVITLDDKKNIKEYYDIDVDSYFSVLNSNNKGIYGKLFSIDLFSWEKFYNK